MRPSAQDVIGDVQHMVGFMIRQVELEQAQPLINCFWQAQRRRQLVNEADAAVGSANRSLGHFVMNVGGSEHRLLQVLWKIGFVQALGNSLLAFVTAIRHNSFHSKSFRGEGDLLGGQP